MVRAKVGVFTLIEGGSRANKIHRYIKIRRRRAGAKNGLLVCPADPSQRYRYIESGPNRGSGTSEQEKRRADFGQGGTWRRGGGGSGSIRPNRFDPLIEPVRYTGARDQAAHGSAPNGSETPRRRRPKALGTDWKMA